MATAGLVDIVTQLADQIRAVYEDADELDVQVEPRWIINPTPLTVDVYPGDPSRHVDSAAQGDYGGYLLTVRARTNAPDTDAAYDLLLDMMDDQDDLSLAGAVLSDTTLDGYAASVDVFDHTGLRAYETPDGVGAHLGFQFSVVVIPGVS